MFAAVPKASTVGQARALIVPHAGYPYSGKTAAAAYKLIGGEQFDAVVVISPSHRVFFKGAAVFDGDGYATPLGTVPIDKGLSKLLGQLHPAVYLSPMGHASGSTRGEHALEVQLPFLQVVLGKFRLVAIVMGDQEEDTINAVAEVLSAGLKDRNVLLVASTDLSHFYSIKKAERLDRAVRAAVEAYDPEGLIEVLESGRGEACGGGIVAAVLKASKRLFGGEIQIIDYTTSAEATGDADEVVGYMSAVIVAERRPEIAEESTPVRGPKQAFSLSAEQKQQLRQVALDSIRAQIADRSYVPPNVEGITEERGVFVTITMGGELRGCIGVVRARTPLPEAVAEMAAAAATDDPRFAPLSDDELEFISIEISVLSPLKRMHDFDRIVPGRDGLMIKLDLHSGLLLPQVATDNGWDAPTFLEQTCLKAGLPKNSYKDKRAEVYSFTADVF